MECDDSARDALKAGGISAAVAKQLVDELGFEKPGDLVHITQVSRGIRSSEINIKYRTAAYLLTWT